MPHTVMVNLDECSTLNRQSVGNSYRRTSPATLLRFPDLSNIFCQRLHYQTQGDLERAEEYYARAILADPQDGEILSQYAKLVWELHRDQPRASTYFERAVQAAPEDRFVSAHFAN